MTDTTRGGVMGQLAKAAEQASKMYDYSNTQLLSAHKEIGKSKDAMTSLAEGLVRFADSMNALVGELRGLRDDLREVAMWKEASEAERKPRMRKLTVERDKEGRMKGATVQ